MATVGVSARKRLFHGLSVHREWLRRPFSAGDPRTDDDTGVYDLVLDGDALTETSSYGDVFLTRED